MQKFILKLTSVGIRSEYDKDLVEKTKLVNGISLMGVPISFFYAVLFAFSGYYLHAFTFVVGIVAFSLTILFNKYVGVKFARVYVSLAAPICFGVVNAISGNDMGFYMGFIATTMPAVVIFDNMKQMILIITYSMIILTLSILGYGYCQPITNTDFIMVVHMINLVTVLAAALTIVYIYKRELQASREKLEEKQKEILDSINYAKRIQYTLLAHKSFLNENLPEHFVYFNPKDIVSGDFYWAAKQNKKFYIAVCDSTGHGVPGAFMSLLNIGFLSEAINEKGLAEPDRVLNYVREKLINTISKEGQKDGFDGVLLCINQQTGNITYAAAHNAPVLILDENIIELKSDRMPVGIGERKEKFNLYTISAKKGSMIYLYTDGYADQFGGTKGKKFKYKTLNELLLKNHSQTLENQSKVLSDTFISWKRDLEQVDDVLLIGIRF
jgi:serine phosphatase RsbU (regulator of sigma subunit)